MVVKVGSAASKPSWKFVAPICMAIAVKNVPLVNTTIASADRPSAITYFKPEFN